MLVEKFKFKTASIFDSITGTVKPDIDVGVTNIEGALYLCC
jgi:hypothetical protein